MKKFTAFLALALPALQPAWAEPARDTVVLLHGLGRGPLAMKSLERSLRAEGYHVVNVSYPSRRHPIARLATDALDPFLSKGRRTEATGGGRVHIVTHSLGGILVRQYLHDHGVPDVLGRVVMLAPPNHGSEIPDHLRKWALYRWWNGPAGVQLGTDRESTPNLLGPLPGDAVVGVIAGDRSLNPLFSALIPGADDGKVSVASTHLSGETDHLVVPHSHTWLMWRRAVVGQVASFLRSGRFERAAEPSR